MGFLQDILVDKKYRVGYRIGEGGFGLVYAGTTLLTTTSELRLK
jgi:hypothetical protein